LVSGSPPAPCTATQKATVVTETEGNEEPTLTYCSNVLDEVEAVYGYPQTGQPGWYALHEETASETEVANVNVASGNFTLTAEDVAPTSGDSELALNRIYNAQGPTAAGTLGQHWRWGTGPSVYLVDDGATVFVHGPSGYIVALKRTGYGTYSGPPEYEGTLTKNANGTYTLTDENNPTFQFSSAGVLTSETTEEGNTFNITDTTLSGKSVLHALAPATGKALEVTYNTTPLVTQTTDPGGNIRKYEYNTQKQLSIYTSPSGAKTEYGYETTSGYLDRVAGPEGTVETIVTSAGKVSEVAISSGGELTTDDRFTYEAASSPTCEPAVDSGETVITAVNTGATTTYCYTPSGVVTGPRSEAEEPEIEGEGEPAEISASACAKEHPGGYCGEDEPAPEANEEEGMIPALVTTNASTSPDLAVSLPE